MTTATIALDHAATTSLRPEARRAMMDAWDAGFGNASGTHRAARRAKNALESARERAAHMLGAAHPLDVVFTSGGTEADNLAVRGVADAAAEGSVVVSTIEHKAVLAAAAALDPARHPVRAASPEASGVLPPEAVASLVDEDTVLVSVMAANNELGTIQPIADIADAVRSSAPHCAVHTDAVQAYVGGGVDISSLGVDLASLSGHKFGGPQGVGMLVVDRKVRIAPVTHGGGQEAGRRPGTSNVAGVLGMVAAMEAVEADRERFRSSVGSERDAFEQVIVERFPSARVTGADVARLPHITHVRFPGVLAETLLIRLDRAGIHAAAGSACQSGAIEPSHVTTAIGMDATEAAESVRFSFGWDTPRGTGERAAHVVAEIVADLVEAVPS